MICTRKKILHLFDKGDKGISLDYQPVLGRNVICKLLAKVIRKQLNVFSVVGTLSVTGSKGWRQKRLILPNLEICDRLSIIPVKRDGLVYSAFVDCLLALFNVVLYR